MMEIKNKETVLNDLIINKVPSKSILQSKQVLQTQLTASSQLDINASNNSREVLALVLSNLTDSYPGFVIVISVDC